MSELKPCPFCGSQPSRKVEGDILSVCCENCVSVGFHNHVRHGCIADAQWNTRTPDPIADKLAEALNHMRYCAVCAESSWQDCDGGIEAEQALSEYQEMKGEE